jgi:hypothetical protein
LISVYNDLRFEHIILFVTCGLAMLFNDLLAVICDFEMCFDLRYAHHCLNKFRMLSEQLLEYNDSHVWS